MFNETAPPTFASTCRRADQSADNGSDRSSPERDPSGVALVMDVVNDMMPGRRRAMRTMPPVMRRGHRRTRRQNHPSHENRNCLDDLVHITPTFPDFLSLHKARNPHRQNLTKTFQGATAPQATPDTRTIELIDQKPLAIPHPQPSASNISVHGTSPH